MADSRAIGIFDSGLGGLTVARQIMNLCPDESIVYFGDTGRVPYGTKGVDTIKKYAAEDIRFLYDTGSDNGVGLYPSEDGLGWYAYLPSQVSGGLYVFFEHF